MNPAVRKQLGLGIVQRYKATLPPPEFKNTVLKDLKERMTEIGKTCMQRCEFQYFGSYASGFCKKGADADFSLTWSGFDYLCQGHEHFDQMVNKKLMRLGKTCAESGMDGCRHVASRIPVLQMIDIVHPEITIDISAGNVGGVENSKILNLIHDVHPVIPLYIYAIKEFGKARQVIAPEMGTFNSFTQTTMGISVLQELGLLPVFSRQSGLWGELTYSDVEFTLSPEKSGFKLHPALSGLNPADDAAMGDACIFMLSKFAEYYTLFDYGNGCISLTHPRQTRDAYRELVKAYLEGLKESKRNSWEIYNEQHLKVKGKIEPIDENDLSAAMQNEEQQRVNNSPFVVVDYINYVNCGRRVKMQKKAYCMQQIQDLNDMLNKNSKGNDLTADVLFRATNELKPNVSNVNYDGSRRVTTF